MSRPPAPWNWQTSHRRPRAGTANPATKGKRCSLACGHGCPKSTTAPSAWAVADVDADVIAAAFAGRADVDVVTDPSLSTGEARLEGAWAQAQLTRAARWNEVAEALDGV